MTAYGCHDDHHAYTRPNSACLYCGNGWNHTQEDDE